MQARERPINNTHDKHGQAREREKQENERNATIFPRATRLSDIEVIGDLIREWITQKIRNGKGTELRIVEETRLQGLPGATEQELLHKIYKIPCTVNMIATRARERHFVECRFHLLTF
jgi:hypothetical protein